MLKTEEQTKLKENNLMLRTLMRIEKTKFISMLEETDVKTIESTIRIKGYLMTIGDFFFTDKKGCYILSLEEKEFLRIYEDLLQNRLNELENNNVKDATI